MQSKQQKIDLGITKHLFWKSPLLACTFSFCSAYQRTWMLLVQGLIIWFIDGNSIDGSTYLCSVVINLIQKSQNTPVPYPKYIVWFLGFVYCWTRMTVHGHGHIEHSASLIANVLYIKRNGGRLKIQSAWQGVHISEDEWRSGKVLDASTALAWWQWRQRGRYTCAGLWVVTATWEAGLNQSPVVLMTTKQQRYSVYHPGALFN